MTIWDYVDRHPVLTFFFMLFAASCVPSFKFVWVRKPKKTEEPKP